MLKKKISNGVKLIYVTGARLPTEKAHGIQIMQMCQSFALVEAERRGYQRARTRKELELVVPRRFNKIKEDVFAYYAVARNFQLKKLPCLDLIPLDKYLGLLASWFTQASFCFFVFCYLLFRRADIIYTRDFFLLPLSLLKRNVFFEAHTFPKNYFLYSFWLKRVKGIITITEGLKRLFAEKGLTEDKVLVAPDGVDINKFKVQSSKFKVRKRLNLPLEKKIVVYTGHLYKWKGATVLMEAAQKSEIRNPKSEILFVFVGGTEQDVKSFKFQVLSFKLNNVLVIGHRPYSEIPLWLAAADVLVSPNSAKEDISRYWTSPLKMFEYMASQRPIVASNLPSIREVLSEQNAVLVEPDNPKALAEGIKNVLENPDLSAKIAKQAFQDVQNYTWQKRAENILRFVSVR